MSLKKFAVFLVLIGAFAGCLERASIEKIPIVEQTENKTQGIYDNANRLLVDYQWKLNLVDEIQQRTDALREEAGREMYVEWKHRNDEAVEAGERLATYITENRNLLNYYWTSDILVMIAKNKVTFERDNQALEQMASSLEQPEKSYEWQLDFYGREGGRELGILKFTNRGKELSDVKFRFELYRASGALYSEESVPIGNIASNKVVRKKISLPSRYSGAETWSRAELSVLINSTTDELWVYENNEWTEQQLEHGANK